MMQHTQQRGFGAGNHVSLLSLLCVLMLSACGFRPVYGTQYQSERSAASASLAEIEVVTNNDRLSQLFKAELEDRLNPENLPVEKRFRLTANIAEVNIPLFVAPDGTYGRGNLQYTLTYTLVRVADGKTISANGLTRVSSYAASETNAIYASYVAQQDAKKRGVIELASDLAMRLGNALDTDAAEPTP